ncbi:Rho GTPase activation protein [Lactarius indigo]|nr:Rho GTPase activation protein [Lactarius indigo]
MSFMSVEPQPRVVLESHSNSLLAQFDTQLQIIANRYLAFFLERRSIEATYIESLRKLHRKAKTTDASFDPRAEPTTTRAAWETIRDNLDEEANTQQSFVDILDKDVIKPLTTLKESKDRTRNRIEEDLKRSAKNYADHAENKVSKLQQAYLKKYYPQQYATSPEVSQRPQSVPNKRFGGKLATLLRNRREDSLEPEPAKPVKSEEVSDNDCRLAVGRLNTLRSTRAEHLGEGYDCLEELVFAPTVKDVLVKYVDGMITACVKHDKLVTSTKTRVEKAVAGADTSDLRASFRRTLSFAIPLPTLYRNYRPGAYSDLIFGVPLVDVETNEDDVPKVMKMCIEEVEKRGMDTNEIYSTHQSLDEEVLQLRDKFEREKTFSFSSTDNIHSVAMLLKRYLWDLPEPLFALSLKDYRNYKQNRNRYIENDFSLWRSKIRELHPVHRASLGTLLRHLLRVSTHSDKNAMTAEVLAARFRYGVLRGDQVIQDGVRVKFWRISFKMRISYLMSDSFSLHLSPHLMWQRRHLPTPTARCF